MSSTSTFCLTLAPVGTPDLPRKQLWTSQAVKDHLWSPGQITRAAYQKDDGTTLRFTDNLVTHTDSQGEVLSDTVLILHWPALPQAGLHCISAILPDPNLLQNHHIHVFWENLYVRFDELKGEVVEGSRPISESWLALADAGIPKVDAVVAYQSNTAVFFSGDRYAIVAFEILEKGLRSRLIESGTFASRWPVLSKFKTIEYILPETGRLVFFSGRESVSVAEEHFRSDSAGVSTNPGVLSADDCLDSPLPMVRGGIAEE